MFPGRGWGVTIPGPWEEEGWAEKRSYLHLKHVGVVLGGGKFHEGGRGEVARHQPGAPDAVG